MEELSQPLISKTSHLLEAFNCLKESPYYFWLTLCIKFTSFAAFSMIAICSSLYLTTVLKFTEKESGLIFASFGIIIGFFSIIFSNLAKTIGLRWTLVIGNISGCIGYSLVLIFENKYLQYLFISVFLMFAISINLTNTKLAVKYYTYPKSRSIAYTLYYLVFFVAAGFSSGIVDLAFTFYDEKPELYKALFGIGVGLYLATLVFSLFLKEIDIQHGEESHIIRVMPAKEALKLKSLWKFTCFVILIIITKSVYFHLSGTLPLYMTNNIENGKHFGLIMVLHQVMLLIATPICTYLVFYLDKYTILVVGSFVTSISPIVLYYESSYLGVVIFVLLVSIGESIYAPRLTDYTIEISPCGAEAIFLGIAATPNSLALIVTGISGGFLSDKYCDTPENCQNIWVWIASYALFANFLMFALRRFIEVKPNAE